MAPGTGKYLGQSARSKEAARQIIGRGRFVDDMTLPRMVHAMIVRSPYGHARIRSASADDALAAPGVLAVLTPDDVKSLSRAFKPGRYAAGLKVPISEYSVATDKVRYIGEPVAMVCAHTRPRAEDALELVAVDYEPLQAVTSTDDATRDAAPLIYEELGSNVAWTGVVAYGDVDQAFRDADTIVRESLAIHRYSSTPLEPFACLAEYVSGALTIWCNSQAPEVIYEAITEAIGTDRVRVIVPDVGGGFGQKIHLIKKYAVLTSLMAIKVGRPVKWIEDRSEHMMAGGHSCDQKFDVEAAVKADGEVLGLLIRNTDDVGGSVSTATIHFTNKLNNLFNTYKVQHLRLEGTSVVTNKCPVVPNRGIGKPGMCFIWERMMDRIAQQLRMDPVAVRRRNLIGADEFPYTTPNGNIYGSGDYQLLLDKALKNIDYDGVRKEQAEGRKRGRLLGVGVVIAVEPGGRNAARDMAIFPTSKQIPGAGGVQGAVVKVEKNGSIRITLASINCGQNHETTAAQIAAEVLDISPDRIAFTGPYDSASSPWGVASSNSGNNFHLYDVGAVHGAATKLRQKIVALAAHLLEAEAADVQMQDGIVWSTSNPSAKMTFAEIGKIAYTNQSRIPADMEPGLDATYYHRHKHADPMMLPDLEGRVRAQYTFSAAAHAAVVEIDQGTGRVRVVRYCIVSDNGVILNPGVVDGQIYGSVAHGISVALGEGFVYGADGQLLTLTLLEYGKSTTLETPHIEIEHVPFPDPFTTLGQKAAGEGAAIPSPAAIAGAVEDALAPFDIKIRQLPLSPERVWTMIREATVSAPVA